MAEKNQAALDRLLHLLKTSGADAWEVTDREEDGWEFYFIRHRLDQHRAKHLREFSVKVFRRFDEYLGSAGAKIPCDASEEDMRRVIEGLCSDASYVRNPAYTLNQPCAAADGETEAETPDIRAISEDFLQAMAAVPETETEDLNSYEIFVSKIRRRFLNSEGIDVTAVYPSSMLEAVVNARKDGHEIELYRLFDSGACDREQLVRELTEALRYGRDRLVVLPTPALEKMDVVFTTDPARELYWYFIDRLNTGAVYRGISDWKPGDTVAPVNLTLTAVKYLPNSSQNAAYDPEGAPIRDLTLIERGVAAHYFGNRQFSQYLHVEDSFQASNFAVSGGIETEAELREGDYLEVVEFSDFQCDYITGDIAGEIRLAYLHQGGKVTPVCGGSISGSMKQMTDTLRFSKEQKQYDCLLIPAVTRLKDVTITGAE